MWPKKKTPGVDMQKAALAVELHKLNKRGLRTEYVKFPRWYVVDVSVKVGEAVYGHDCLVVRAGKSEIELWKAVRRQFANSAAVAYMLALNADARCEGR